MTSFLKNKKPLQIFSFYLKTSLAFLSFSHTYASPYSDDEQEHQEHLQSNLSFEDFAMHQLLLGRQDVESFENEYKQIQKEKNQESLMRARHTPLPERMPAGRSPRPTSLSERVAVTRTPCSRSLSQTFAHTSTSSQDAAFDVNSAYDQHMRATGGYDQARRDMAQYEQDKGLQTRPEDMDQATWEMIQALSMADDLDHDTPSSISLDILHDKNLTFRDQAQLVSGFSRQETPFERAMKIGARPPYGSSQDDSGSFDDLETHASDDEIFFHPKQKFILDAATQVSTLSAHSQATMPSAEPTPYSQPTKDFFGIEPLEISSTPWGHSSIPFEAPNDESEDEADLLAKAFDLSLGGRNND